MTSTTTAPTTPTRVMYCESNTDGTIGGSHYCMLYLIEQLDRRRYEPIVVFYQDHSLVPRFRKTAETIIWQRPAQYRPAWLKSPLMRGPLRVAGRLIRRAVNLCKWLSVVPKQIRFLRERRIGLVHLNNSITINHDWMWAALLTGTPCMTHERGLNARYRFFDRFLGVRLKLVVAISEWVRNHMVARGVTGDNIRVLYDGLDPAELKVSRSPEALRKEWDIRDDQTVVGIVGNIRAWKGQEVVVRALVDVVKRYRDIVCLFVGDATPGDIPYKRHLESLVAEHSLQKNVRFTGFQKNPADYLNLMSIVLHASVDPEPYGMVVLEAMALKKPVIASRAGGPTEVVVDGKTGFTYPPGDATSLATHLVSLLDNPKEAATMGQRGYERLVADFSQDGYMRLIQDAYARTLAEASGTRGMSRHTQPA